MAFCIVQTRKTKKSLPSMTVVPANWVEDKFVYWPPNNIISLSKNEESKPDKQTWKKQKCKLLGRAKTIQQAEEMMNVLEKVTDSEDAAQLGLGTRATPAKKQPKFKSKSYNLVPQQGSGSNIGKDSHPLLVPSGNTDTSASSMLTVASPVQTQVPATKSKQFSNGMSQPISTTEHVQSLHRKQPTVPDSATINIGSSQANSAVESVQTNLVLGPSSQDVNYSPATYLMPQTVLPVRNPAPVLHHQNLNYEPTHTSTIAHGVQSDSVYSFQTPKTSSVQQVNVTNFGSSVPQQITIPVFMGNDGKQYTQLSNGNYYEVTDNSSYEVDGPVTTIKQDEVDLGIDNDLDINKSITPPLDDFDYSTIASELRKINDRLDVYDGKVSKLTAEVCKINDRLDVQEGLLVKITEFMANFNRLMTVRNSNIVTPNETRHEENFSEFENMAKLDSDQSFKALDQSLADAAFSGKFFRYLHSIYSLNGKRESGPLFRTIVRKFLAPNVLIPYSWMGNKRTKKGSTGDACQNINFQETFPNFIKVMHQVMQAADCSNTREQNENLFKNLLRYKNLELKRFENGSGEHRASSSRKRRKLNKVEAQAVQTNLDEPSQEPTPTPEIPPTPKQPDNNQGQSNVDEPSQEPTTAPELSDNNQSQSSKSDSEEESGSSESDSADESGSSKSDSEDK